MKIGVPVLNRGDLLLNLVRSIDVPADALIIVNRIGPVDSSVSEAVARLENDPPKHISIEIHRTEGNLGVAGSWNKIIDHFEGDCVIANSDICFTKGVLKCALDDIEARRDIVLHYLRSAACFYVSERFTRVLGWFDENFYPAYHEDSEMAFRCDTLNVPRRNVRGLAHDSIIHGGSQTLKSANAEQRRFIGAANKIHGEYLTRKWGDVSQKPRVKAQTKSPFGDDALHASHWNLSFDLRSRIAKWCHHFTGHECPLVYHRWQGGLS